MTDYAKKYNASKEAANKIKSLEKECAVLAGKLQSQTELELKIQALECACAEYNRQLQDAKRKNSIRMQLGDYTLLFDGCEIVKSDDN